MAAPSGGTRYEGMPLSLQFAFIVCFTSIPAFVIGLFFVLADPVRTRSEAEQCRTRIIQPPLRKAWQHGRSLLRSDINRPNQALERTADRRVSSRMVDSTFHFAAERAARQRSLSLFSLDREHVTSARTPFPDTRVVLGFVCLWALAVAIRGFSADSGRAGRMFHILHCGHCDFIGIAIFASVVDVLSSIWPCSISRAHVRPRLHRKRRARL